MTRRDPFGEIEELLERMGREFEELGGTLDTPGGPDFPEFPGARDVDVDVIEDDESITVLADLPGFEEADIDVELREDSLSIAAARQEDRDFEIGDAGADDATDSDVRYRRHERRSESVSRRIPIAGPVEREGATASYENGVLTVTLPKRSETGGGHSIDVE